MSSGATDLDDERRRLVAELTGVGIWEVEPQSGRTYWDHRARAILGAPPTGPVDQDLFAAILHPDDRDRIAEQVRRAYDPSCGKYDTEYRVVVDGEIRWVRAKGVTVFDADGRAMRFIGSVLDITADREALLERERLAAAAAAANRAKDDFLAMLGHELRNPLSPILLAVEMLRERGESSREAQMIDRQARHLARLVDDLLDISRITRGKVRLRPVRTTLEEVVQRAVEAVSPAFGAQKQRLDLRLPDDPVPLFVDPDRMTQVVSNLLNNASKFSDAGSTVTVIARATDDEAIVEIIDEGVGLTEGAAAQLFEPFEQRPQTIARSQGGLGLGLAIAKNLTELHQGRLAVHSDGPGLGTRFSVVLPLRPTTFAPAPTPKPKVVARSARVLLVEDSDDTRELLELGLKLCGHDVRSAADGPAALDLAETFAPQVVLCDLGLPILSGYEVAERIRARFGDAVALVALTGYGQASDRERTAAAGFDDHLTKPASVSQIIALMEALLTSKGLA